MAQQEHDVEQLIAQLAHRLGAVTAERGIGRPAIIGIHTGGVWVAERLQHYLDINDPLGYLDISFYRDDFTRVGMHPQVRPSQIPFNVDDRTIILVDDVLYTGRTVRAALNEIFDYGRPHAVVLATLVERSGRELPIQADAVGMHMDLGAHEQVKLQGPEELRLTVTPAR